MHRAAGTDWLDHLHAGFVWLLAAIGAWEVAWGIDQLVAGQAVWPLIAWALVPAALLLLLALRGERIAWPVRAHLSAYLVNGGRSAGGVSVGLGHLHERRQQRRPGTAALRAGA